MKPIIFSTEMVQAILAGRKTQTRRVIKTVPNKENFLGYRVDKGKLHAGFGQGVQIKVTVRVPYEKGDILWVRETWATHKDFADVFERNLTHGYYYRANEQGKRWTADRAIIKWRPSIFMPKEAARLFIRVTDVRLERLQDITEEDAWQEGVTDPYDYQDSGYYDKQQLSKRGFHECAFAGLWDKLNAKRGYGWDANPWVWVIGFEGEENNEDETLSFL